MSGSAKRWWGKARRWRRRSAMQREMPRIAVLMYHRVAEPLNDPWKMCVRPRRFMEHMSVLRRHCEVVDLASIQSTLERPRSRPVVAITFDDGYRDNLETALPILKDAGLPATLFLATDGINAQQPWWWDVLADLVMEPDLPRSLDMPVGLGRVTWNLAEGAELLRDRLWEQISRLPGPEIDAVMAELCDWSGHEPRLDPLRLPLTAGEVQKLIRSGLVSLGCHSASHLRMPVREPADCARELVTSRRACQDLAGVAPAAFAFPFGEYDQRCVELVEAAGFHLACTSDEGLVTETSHALSLPRLGVGDWSGAYFSAWLRHYWCA